MSRETYEKWLNHPCLDEATKEELKKMSEKEINDAFYTNLAFGTAGMRGVLGAGCNRMNVYTIRKANTGFAKYLLENTDYKKGVAIGYDNRHFSYEFAIESARVLATYNIPSYVFTSLRPTPELSYAVRHLGCAGGIMITASHNPKEYNGYKLYDERGCQLVPELMDKVIKNVAAVKDELDIVVNLTKEQEAMIHMINKEVDDPYVEEVKTIQIYPDADKSNLKVVFTPQHGTARELVDRVMKETGYHLIPVEEQMFPDPDFINTITPNPEEKDAYKLAVEYCKKHNADIAIATDPDADRVGVVVKQGDDYVLMSGNQTGSVLLNYVFNSYKEKGMMPEHPVMFNTVVTSDLGEAVAKKYGVECEKTLTGFKFIGSKIHEHETKKDKNFVFGYEESYGYLIKPFVRDKDAVQACLIISECANYYKAKGKTLLDVLHDLYKEFGAYEESQTSVTLKGEEGAKAIANITGSLRSAHPDTIRGEKVVRVEDYKLLKCYEGGKEAAIVGFPPSDVLKFFLADGSWIAVRPSGTEPKCKFYYCVKGNSVEDAKKKTENYHEFMNERLKQLIRWCRNAPPLCYNMSGDVLMNKLVKILLAALLLVGCAKDEVAEPTEEVTCSLDSDGVCFVDDEYLIENEAQIYLGNLSVEVQQAIIDLWDQTYPDKKGLIGLNEAGELSEEQIIESLMNKDDVSIMYASEDLLTYYIDHLYKLDDEIQKVKTEGYDVAIEDYYIPATIDGVAFLHNKTMLEAFGVDVSDNNNDGLVDAIDDWDKIFTLVSRYSYDLPSFKNKEITTYFPFCFNEETLSYFMISAGFKLFPSLEGDKPGFDSEEFRNALTFIYDAGKFPFALHKRTVDNNGTRETIYVPYSADDYIWNWEKVYTKELAPMGIVTSWMDLNSAMSINEDEFIISKFPTYNGKEMSSLVSYSGFAIEDDSNYPSAAHAVMKFLQSKEVVQLLVDYTTYMPYTYGYELDYKEDTNRKQYTEELMKGVHIPLLGLPDNMYVEAMQYYNDGSYLVILRDLYDHKISVEEAQKRFVADYKTWYTKVTTAASLDEEKQAE